MASRFEQRDGKYVAIVEVAGRKNQEFTADTIEELTAKLIQAQEHASRKIETLKAAAPHPALAPTAAQVKPRALTADERKNVAMALQSGSATAVHDISRAEFGDVPDKVRERLNENSHLRARIAALEVGAAFRKEHPEFVANPDNEAAMIAYLQARNLAFDLANLNTAFDDLKARGEIEILEKPAASTGNPPQDNPPPENPPTRPRTAATGLTGGRSSVKPPERRAALTREELRDMPAAEYRRRMGDPAFVKRVEELTATRAS